MLWHAGHRCADLHHHHHRLGARSGEKRVQSATGVLRHYVLRVGIRLGDVHELAVGDVAVGRGPAGGGGRLVVRGEVHGGDVRREVAEAEIEPVAAGEHRAVLRVARHEDARAALLHRMRPHRDLPVAVVAPLPAERLGLVEALLDEQRRLLEPVARLPRVRAVGEVLVRRAAQHADAQATIEEVVEHRVLLGDADGVVDRDVGAEHPDVGVGEALAGDRRHGDRVRRQLLGRVVVLGEVQRVEPGVERGAALVEPVVDRGAAPLGVVAARRCGPRAAVVRSVVGEGLEELELHDAIPLSAARSGPHRR